MKSSSKDRKVKGTTTRRATRGPAPRCAPPPSELLPTMTAGRAFRISSPTMLFVAMWKTRRRRTWQEQVTQATPMSNAGRQPVGPSPPRPLSPPIRPPAGHGRSSPRALNSRWISGTLRWPAKRRVPTEAITSSPNSASRSNKTLGLPPCVVACSKPKDTGVAVDPSLPNTEVRPSVRVDNSGQ